LSATDSSVLTGSSQPSPIVAAHVASTGHLRAASCRSGLLSRRSEEQGQGQVGLAEGATQFTKNLLKRRERRHLIGQASVPERSQTDLFSRKRGLQVFAGFLRNSSL